MRNLYWLWLFQFDVRGEVWSLSEILVLPVGIEVSELFPWSCGEDAASSGNASSRGVGLRHAVGRNGMRQGY